AAENFSRGVGGMLQALGDMAGGLGNIKGVLDNTIAFFADLRGDDAAAEAFRKSAQEAFGWGESIRALGDKLVNVDLDGARAKVNLWADAAHEAAANAEGASGKVTGLGTALGALPAKKVIGVDVDTQQAEARMKEFYDKWSTAITTLAPPPGSGPVPGAPGAPSSANPFAGPFTRPPLGGGREAGGPINGPGPKGRDSVLFWG